MKDKGLVIETDTSTKKFVIKKCPWPPEHYKKNLSHSYLFRTLVICKNLFSEFLFNCIQFMLHELRTKNQVTLFSSFHI